MALRRSGVVVWAGLALLLVLLWLSMGGVKADDPGVSVSPASEYAAPYVGFDVEPVELGGAAIGAWGDMAFDSHSNPHLAYYGQKWPPVGDDGLRYATLQNGSWVTTTIELYGDRHMYPAIAIDNLDHPHISYHAHGALKYARWDGTEWVIAQVITEPLHNSALALDADQHPHIAYCSKTIKVASWDGGDWTIMEIPDSPCEPDDLYDIPIDITIALDDAGHPYVGFVLWPTYSLQLAHWDGTDWSTGPVGEAVAYCHDLALDASGRPHLAYTSSSPFFAKDLAYASWTDTGWVTTTVSSYATDPNMYFAHAALELDSLDRPRIASASLYIPTGPSDDVVLFSYDGTAWTQDLVYSANLDVGMGNVRLALDADGLAHLALNATGPRRLLYASGVPMPIRLSRVIPRVVPMGSSAITMTLLCTPTEGSAGLTPGWEVATGGSYASLQVISPTLGMAELPASAFLLAGPQPVSIVLRRVGGSNPLSVFVQEPGTPLDLFRPPALWFGGFKYYGPQNRNPRLVGDISGDGRADTVAFDPATDLDARGTIIALSTGTGFAKQSLWTHDFNWKGDNYYHREIGDVNGDGMDDVVGFWYGQGVYVGLSSGGSLTPATKWLDGLKWWGPQNRYPRLLGDVNGDGMDDIVAVCPDPNASEGVGVYVSLSTGSAFTKPARKWTGQFGWLGDNYAHRAVGDVNGDGMDDIVGYVPGDGVYVGLSMGSGFATPVEWLDGVRPWGPQTVYPWMLGDVDADGYEDIIAYQSDGHIWVAYSTGMSFEEPVQCSADLSWLQHDSRNTLQVGDVDGANGVDLVAFRYGVGVYVALSEPGP